jgi:hypothetical protein
MTTVQLIVPRAVVLIYDGTNSAQVVDLINTEFGNSTPENLYVVHSESGGVLVVRGGPDPDITIQTGDHVVIRGGRATPLTAVDLARQYVVLGDA